MLKLLVVTFQLLYSFYVYVLFGMPPLLFSGSASEGSLSTSKSRGTFSCGFTCFVVFPAVVWFCF